MTDLVVGPTTINLTFQDDGSSNQFTHQKNIGLDAANWANASTATLTSLGNNRYAFAVPRTSADKQFYRILGTLVPSTPFDTDGDGLTNTSEATLGTTTSLWDTDGDGFSDGVEFAYGTNPLSGASKPVLATKPAVEFAESVSTGTEGSPFSVEITLDQPSAQPLTVKYAIVPANSTATAPGDFTALGGTVVMAGNLSSQSEGIVPIGSFAGTVQSDTAAHFKITSAPMPVASSGITGPSTDLMRTIVLEALPTAGSFHSIAPTRMVGTDTETLTSATSPHLNRMFTGLFAMARELPASVTFP